LILKKETKLEKKKMKKRRPGGKENAEEIKEFGKQD